MDPDGERDFAARPGVGGPYRVAARPHFAIDEIVAPTDDAAIKPASRVGRVESRAWTELRDQPGYWRYSIRWPGGGRLTTSAKYLQPAEPIGCDLEVVVSGHPIKLDTTTTATVAELIEQASSKADVALAPGVEWELRTRDGQRLTWLVGDAELVDGETTLFLDPSVGGGADEEALDEIISEGPPRDGWQGTPPAEGTRRKLILDVIDQRLRGSRNSAWRLGLADDIEGALLRVVDQGATPESGSPASVAMDQLDQFEIPRTRDGAILTIADRVTALADQLVEARRELSVQKVMIDGLSATVNLADKLAETGLPAGTKAVHVVLADNTADSPQPLFVEIEDQDGKGLGCFRSFRDGDYTRIVIPYERYAKGVEAANDSPGGDDPAATIKFLEGEVERLLGQREEARTLEGRFAEERDCAFALLRWLLPVTVAKRID